MIIVLNHNNKQHMDHHRTSFSFCSSSSGRSNICKSAWIRTSKKKPASSKQLRESSGPFPVINGDTITFISPDKPIGARESRINPDKLLEDVQNHIHRLHP